MPVGSLARGFSFRQRRDNADSGVSMTLRDWFTTPLPGLGTILSPDHRWFAPPANIQHPYGIGPCGDRNSNSAVTISRKTIATNYTNRHESDEAVDPQIRLDS